MKLSFFVSPHYIGMCVVVDEGSRHRYLVPFVEGGWNARRRFALAPDSYVDFPVLGYALDRVRDLLDVPRCLG